VIPYLRDPDAIYAQSFATIRAEADLNGIPPELQDVVVRMIHASGLIDLPADLRFSEDFVSIAEFALVERAPIFCDTEAVAAGITRRFLRGNEVVVTLNDARVPALARQLETTRSAAAVDLWRDRLGGSVVVIGNAPTALFRLLELLEQGAPRPAAIVGMPVGFVGAAESKFELSTGNSGVPYLTLHGRRGGSAIAAAALNAIASGLER
jgi:precorrin-8X/cobalt-precorrin-8 methylmutase